MSKVVEIASSIRGGAQSSVTSELPDRLLRAKQVLQIVPLSKSAWYAGVADGRYPKPICLGPRSRAWRLSDILRLVAEGVQK